MNKKVKLGVLTTILVTVIYLSFKLRNDEYADILKFGENSIGTISNHGLKTIDISYTYKDKFYTYTRGIPFAELVEGEQYVFRISTKDPSRISVNMDQPVIDTIAFVFKTTTPTKIEPLWFESTMLEFKYELNGENYRRLQEYYHEDKIPKDLTKLVVKYRVDRPQIAYLVTANVK